MWGIGRGGAGLGVRYSGFLLGGCGLFGWYFSFLRFVCICVFCSLRRFFRVTFVRF